MRIVVVDTYLPKKRPVLAIVVACMVMACSGGSTKTDTAPTPATPSIAVEPPVREPTPSPGEPAPAAERASAGGWSSKGLEAPPHYCDDDGGQEWCDGTQDDDCDGLVDEGCVDCVNQECERFPIPADKFGAAGPGASAPGLCVGPVYCGRIDGYATTTPPLGCGTFHCGTTIYPDGRAKPNGCTIYGRCADGKFEPRGFTW